MADLKLRPEAVDIDVGRAYRRAAEAVRDRPHEEGVDLEVTEIRAGLAAALPWLVDAERDDMLNHYSAALDEIYRLRAALAWERHRIEVLLTYRSLPPFVRKTLTGMLHRFTLAARGQAGDPDAYGGVTSLDLQNSLIDAGAGPRLTRPQWEARDS